MSIKSKRGSALLSVLWLSAAMTAIVFSLASTVRSETERAATATDGIRAYYLASGSIDRAILWIFWGSQFPPRFYKPPMPFLRFNYPTGYADIEISPETGKMNINTAKPEDLFRLIVSVGADPDRARAIAQGIVQYRTSLGETGAPPASTSTFQPRHSSFEEIEELLLIPGMTPELFYGSFDRNSQGRLISRGGLKDCLSPYGAPNSFDANTAQPPLLLSLGISPTAVASMIAARRFRPFKTGQDVSIASQGSPGIERLMIGGNTIWNVRATAHLRLANGTYSDLTRSVAAKLKFLPPDYSPPYQIMRWYDDAWSSSAEIQRVVPPAEYVDAGAQPPQ